MKFLLAKKILVLALAAHGSAAFDAWSTRRAADRMPNSYETNPAMRPFFHSWTIYAFTQITPVATDIWLMKTRRRVVPTLLSASAFMTHLACGVRNVRLETSNPNLRRK